MARTSPFHGGNRGSTPRRVTISASTISYIYMTDRPSIPNEIKRSLRIESGFGCCKCGFPFIEYHHIIPYSEVSEHNPENMMTVCSRCHDIITSGVIPYEEQKILKKNPLNKSKNHVNGEIFLRRNTVTIGNSKFRCNGPLIVVDGEPIIVTTHDLDGNVLLTLSLYDEDNNLLIKIVENEWIVRPSDTWDLESSPRKIVLRQQSKNISLEICLIDNDLKLIGKFWKNGHLVKTKAEGIVVGTNNSNFMACEFSNCFIDVNTETGSSSIVLGKGLRPNQPY